LDPGTCLGLVVDDHGDTTSCATQIEAGVWSTGRLENGWGDDADTFAFFVTDLRTMALRVEAGAPLAAELFDPTGQRLQAATSEAGETGLRWRRTLSQGVYFLRIASPVGDRVDYRILIEEGAW
jgi:hypothetical protein